MNPMERFRANLKVACNRRIEPETWFSTDLAEYCRHLALYYQVDGHAMAVAVINGVVTTCRSIYVNRASYFLVPCNLFNLIVARPGQYPYYYVGLRKVFLKRLKNIKRLYHDAEIFTIPLPIHHDIHAHSIRLILINLSLHNLPIRLSDV